MTSHRTTADQQVAPFMTSGMAFALLFKMAAGGLGRWLRTHRELRRQRRNMRQLRGLSDRTLKDIGVVRAEIPYRVTQKGEKG